jgi:formyl-CoA transferase
MAQPTALAGLRVLDITQVMAGPYCSMILADLGADVIKIEPPAGDSTRQLPGAVGRETPGFNAVNRGKRSVVIDLKKAGGASIVARLARSADILVENYRPGTLAALGLDYATLAADNPRLVYASISGYGQTGPAREKGGFDLVAQGATGLMSVTGMPGGPPAKCGIPVTDLGAALFALVGILAAVEHRHHSGRGQHVDTSLFDAGAALSVWEATEYFATGAAPQPLGSAHRMFAPYQAIRCADGYITLGTANDRLFETLARVLGHPEWAGDGKYAANASRVEHQAALAARIEAITRERTRRHWLDLFEAHGIPCGPINDYAQLFADPQAAARELAVDVQHPTLGAMRSLGSPIKLSETPANARRTAPRLGEHTTEVLLEAGFAEDEIAHLKLNRVIG